jgi:hypothetical protein
MRVPVDWEMKKERGDETKEEKRKSSEVEKKMKLGENSVQVVMSEQGA